MAELTTDALRGNVEAGLRLLLESEKPLYRRTAEVGITDLRELAKRAEAWERLARHYESIAANAGLL